MRTNVNFSIDAFKNVINIIMPRNDALLFSQLMTESSRIDLDDHDALVVRRGNDRFTAMITHREFRQKMIRIDHAQRRIAELCGSYCDYKLVIDANHCHRPDDEKSLRWILSWMNELGMLRMLHNTEMILANGNCIRIGAKPVENMGHEIHVSATNISPDASSSITNKFFTHAARVPFLKIVINRIIGFIFK